MKRICSILLVTIILTQCIFTSGCAMRGTDYKIDKTEMHFGTIMSITLYGKNVDKVNKVIEDSFETINELEMIFSAKLEDSELSRLNNSPIGKSVKVSDRLYDVIERAMYYNSLSDGALDISIGKVVKLWSIGTDDQRVPTDSELSEYIDMNGCSYIKLNSADKTVTITDERVSIDLGAVAKGYAGDVIKELIESKDSSLYGFLNFGGNLVSVGKKPKGEKWNFAITNPLDTSSYTSVMAVENESVVTSGDYERFFVQDGIKYHHIIDAKTCFPSKSGVISATIIGPSSLDCDALSTLCFVAGVDKALQIINGIKDYKALLIDESGRKYYSDDIEEYFTK